MRRTERSRLRATAVGPMLAASIGRFLSARATRAVALFAAGTLAGAVMVGPVGAHIGELDHLINSHLKEVFYTQGQIDKRDFGCRGNSTDDKMVKVGSVCIDKFEASVWSKPNGGTQYGISLDNYPCSDTGEDCKGEIYARSVKGVPPSRFITWFQAQQALANSGKRLVTNAEWQMAAAGTPDPGDTPTGEDCNTDSSGPEMTGARENCVSAWGVRDLIGNVDEWVADWDELAEGCRDWSAFSDDRSCVGGDISNNLPGALLRGGHFKGGSDAGVFAVDGFNAPSSDFNQWGFRGAR